MRAKACRNFADFAASDVAGERDIGSGPRSRAVDRTDDRPGEIADRADQRIDSLFQHLAKVRPGLAGSNRAVGEVRPGAEASADAGDENRAAVGLRRSALNSCRQRFDERCVQRVQALGAIQSERQHAGLKPIQKKWLRRNLGLGRHVRPPNLAAGRRGRLY
jgi:hypothetical protein